jgi:hypothetical protein
MAMKQKSKHPLDPTQLNARLRQWREKHDTPAKLAAAHRKVLLERVSQSMAFDGQPISVERLRILTTGSAASKN